MLVKKLVIIYNIYLIENLEAYILIFVLILSANGKEKREINIFSSLLKYYINIYFSRI